MGIMEEGLFEKIIDEFDSIAATNNFRGEVVFCNMGELFVHPDLTLKRIGYVLKKKNLDYNIQTNGSLLSPAITDQLLDLGFSGEVVISFHGFNPSTYKRIMGLNHESSLENIEYLLSKYNRDKITIQSIPYKWQKGEARALRNFWKERKVKCRMPLPNSRAGLVNFLQKKKPPQLVGCSSNRTLGQMIISFNGDVPLCCNDMAQEVIVGSLVDSSILEVWRGESFSEANNKLYGLSSSGDDFLCKRCELGVFTGSVFRRFRNNLSYELRKFFWSYLW